MAGTERWAQLSGSLVLLLVLTAGVAAPASAASDGASSSLAAASPAAFAERIATRAIGLGGDVDPRVDRVDPAGGSLRCGRRLLLGRAGAIRHGPLATTDTPALSGGGRAQARPPVRKTGYFFPAS